MRACMQMLVSVTSYWRWGWLQVLEGQKVVPAKARELGFSFKYPYVKDALRSILPWWIDSMTRKTAWHEPFVILSSCSRNVMLLEGLHWSTRYVSIFVESQKDQISTIFFHGIIASASCYFTCSNFSVSGRPLNKKEGLRDNDRSPQLNAFSSYYVTNVHKHHLTRVNIFSQH